jgi:hypothetical protein
MTTVTHAVFFGDDRYHLTISPVLCILAAAALRFGESAAPESGFQAAEARLKDATGSRGYA